VSEEFLVPVCRVHHRELHCSGSESAWWQKYNIDPLPGALRLWQETRADGKLTPKTEGITRRQAANQPGSISQEGSRQEIPDGH
jgi:hypothetical protein